MIGRTLWTWARLGAGAAILAVLVERLGAGPFREGLRLTSTSSLLAATAITTLTTVCCAWRWRLVADSLGVSVAPGRAVAAYYRSQFLNATLPGGVLGDVHRGVSQGRDVGDIGRSLRSVAWERALGQVVQIAVTVIVVVVLPSPIRGPVLVIATTVAAVVLVIALAVWIVTGRAPGMPGRAARAVRNDVRDLQTAGRWVAIALTSVVATAGHVTIFLIAVRSTGATVSTDRLLPVAFAVLLASSIPTNIAGWGPRELTAAWAFSAVGLSASQGVTAAVVYGVMALVGALPGAVVLVTARREVRVRRPPTPHPPVPVLEDVICG